MSALCVKTLYLGKAQIRTVLLQSTFQKMKWISVSATALSTCILYTPT